jgi:hypothetical protein
MLLDEYSTTHDVPQVLLAVVLQQYCSLLLVLSVVGRALSCPCAVPAMLCQKSRLVALRCLHTCAATSLALLHSIYVGQCLVAGELAPHSLL